MADSDTDSEAIPLIRSPNLESESNVPPIRHDEPVKVKNKIK